MVVQNFKINPLQGVPSERVGKIRDEMLSHPFEYDIERARCYTRIYKQMEDAPPCMKKAKALEEYLRCIPIRIDSDELIVGKKSSKVRADPMEVERGANVDIYGFLLDDNVDEDMKEMLRAQYYVLQRFVPMSDEELDEMKNTIVPFWKGKTIKDLKVKMLKDAGLLEDRAPPGPLATMMSIFLSTLPDTYLLLDNLQGHTIPGYTRVLKMGFKGIEKMAAEKLEKLKETYENYNYRKDFLEAAQITARAVCDYSNRYADLAVEMAKTASEGRSRELLDIAERARRVPAYPPRDFMDAIQAIWMTNVVMEMSYGELNVLSQGRVDQYLIPYYRTDIAEGRLTNAEALEAIEEYLVKLSTIVFAGQNNITIGGVDKSGNDATNEVSYLFLEATANVKSLLNTLSIRVSSKTPRDFLKRVFETHRHTSGIGLHNDDMIIPQLQEDGYNLEDARDYSIVGCVEPCGTGNDFSYTGGNGIFMAIVFSMALNQGCVSLFDDVQVGAKTPDPSTFTTFEDVKQAYVDQLTFAIDRVVKMAEIKDKAFADYYPSPLLSSTMIGCLEKGLDCTRNGAIYNNSCMNGQALSTVVNSLAAIRWAVFEEKIVSMGDLVKHMNGDFRKAKELREMLLNKAPKYGNGDEKVDELAKWVADVFSEIARKHHVRGGNGIYRTSLVSAGGAQVLEGGFLGSTPDGRLSNQAVSNGISPTNGTEKNGLTMALRSAALASKALTTNGVGMNVVLSPTMLSSEEGLDQMVSIIEAYFELGGRNFQMNLVDTETLKDAQIHPGKYPELSVKVSGYSARFIDLTKAIQDDIIARTEFKNF